jgi:hypothetical protein
VPPKNKKQGHESKMRIRKKQEGGKGIRQSDRGGEYDQRSKCVYLYIYVYTHTHMETYDETPYYV